MPNGYILITIQKLLFSSRNKDFLTEGYTPLIHLRKILKLVIHGNNKLNQLITFWSISCSEVYLPFRKFSQRMHWNNFPISKTFEIF